MISVKLERKGVSRKYVLYLMNQYRVTNREKGDDECNLVFELCQNV